MPEGVTWLREQVKFREIDFLRALRSYAARRRRFGS